MNAENELQFIDTNVLVAAIELSGRHQISYWDAAIIVSAQRLGCHILWSEDLKTAVYGDVKVRNPFGPAGIVQEQPGTGYAASAAPTQHANRTGEPRQKASPRGKA